MTASPARQRAKPRRPTADRLPKGTPFLRVARPDAIDVRDRHYRPAIGSAPPPTLFPKQGLPVKHQGDTMACTGFALSLVVEHLLRAAGRERKPAISPFMLYSMARRYDEYPGSTQDKGSSLRGAMKGWFKHGACRAALFPGLEMPPASRTLAEDWWFDAVKRPLGAYYRVDKKAITDMHAALNEVGILYASAACHAGWDEGIELTPLKKRPTSLKGLWEIPVRGGHAAHSGHAFAIVGYNERGFLIQNSWGTDWGSYGYAILSYDDWIANAMDCWVAQLGVVTRDHTEISKSPTLRSDAAGRVLLAASEVLRHRELSPFIVNMGYDGALSNSGVFRTRPDDVRAIVDVQLAQARRQWGLNDGVIDVCIFAHGGLVGERAAAAIAAQWIPMLYEQQVFPVFLMWETDFFTSALACIEAAVRDVPRTTAGGMPLADEWWNERLERLLARPGSRIWDEMKQNADALSAYKPGVPDDGQAGGVLLYRHFKQGVDQRQIRLHVVGHSAGCIVASLMIDRLVRDGLLLESVSFMAPAVRVDTFEQTVQPHLASGAVRRYQQFHLSERAERQDHSCGAYQRSLLCLVSESFEGGSTTPILGLQRFFDPVAATLPNTTAWVAPGPVSASTTHGGFDDDAGTRGQVLRFIRG